MLEGEDQELKEFLLIDAGLIKRIVDASKTSDHAQDLPKGCRKGYMGFVTNMTVNIVNASKNNDKIANFLNTAEGWNEYLNGSFSEVRSIETSSAVEKQSSSGEDLLNESPLFYNNNNNEEDDDFNFGDDNNNAFSFGDSAQWVEEPESDSNSADSEENNEHEGEPDNKQPNEENNEHEQGEAN